MSVICPACNVRNKRKSTRCVCGFEFQIHPTEQNFLSQYGGEKSFGNMIFRDIANGIEITIPTKTDALVVVLFGFSTLFWAVIEALLIWLAITTFSLSDLSEGDIALLAIPVAWSVMGGFVISRWLWIIGGKEIIVLTHSHLSTKKDIYGYGFKRIFDLNRIKNLCVSYEGGARESHQSGGAILFDYDSDWYRFGLSIDEEEAIFLVNELNKRNFLRAG